MKEIFKMIFTKEMLTCLAALLFKYLPVYIYSLFLPKRKQLWLISERKNDARDNGYILFKYLRDKHPELEVYYAIKYSCEDYPKVNGLGNVINWGTYRHFYYCINATIVASTDFGLGYPYLLMRPLLIRLFKLRNKFVFLQHGITKDNLTHAKKNKLGANLFVCGAKPEYDYISANFGYNDDEVKYLGFARFDNLFNTCSENQILYMPTWRTWLNDVDFEGTDYYKNISSLLASPEFNSFLDESNTEFIFFVHPAVRDKKRYFEKFGNSHIKITNNHDYDLQNLLKSAQLLITDYSSIYFDFAYLDKPLIYYQFDYDEYRKYQYKQGYFDYKCNGFGPVIVETNGVIEHIKNIRDTHWKNPVEYSNRSSLFFPIKDTHNCMRHYQELCKLDNIDE